MQGSKRDTDVKRSLLDYVGEGEGGMIWENSIGTCILPYLKQVTRCKFDAWSRALKAGPLGQLGGGNGKGGGRVVQYGETYVHLRVIHVDVWQKPPQYCKEIILQLK